MKGKMCFAQRRALCVLDLGMLWMIFSFFVGIFSFFVGVFGVVVGGVLFVYGNYLCYCVRKMGCWVVLEWKDLFLFPEWFGDVDGDVD